MIITSLNAHRVSVLVNGEPVLRCKRVSHGYMESLWPFLPKGECKLRFTAERIPDCELGTEGSRAAGGSCTMPTVVKLISGSATQPVEVLEWTATKDHDSSPEWTVFSDVGWRPDLGRHDEIGEVDDAARAEIASLLSRLKGALEAKDLAMVGVDRTCLERARRAMGFPGTTDQDIFGANPYEVRVATMDGVCVIPGKKTLLIQTLGDEAMYYAGLAKNAPREMGKMYFCMQSDSLHLARIDGKLTILWPGLNSENQGATNP